MTPFAAMRLRRPGAAGPVFKAASTTVFPASTFSTSSTSYVDLLNGSGGSVISVSVTKSAGTSIWIRAGMSARVSSNTDVFFAVNDGTSDNVVASRYAGNILNVNRPYSGEVLVSGLAAGTYTFKLRVKTGGGTLSFTNTASAYLTAIEVT